MIVEIGLVVLVGAAVEAYIHRVKLEAAVSADLVKVKSDVYATLEKIKTDFSAEVAAIKTKL